MPTTAPKKIARLGAAWMDDNDIRSAIVSINASRAKHEIIVRNAKIQLERRRAELDRSLSGLDQRDRASMLNKALTGYRSELVRDTADKRKALTRDLASHSERILSAAAHYRSPMQMLMRHTLGSERRSRIQQQIEHSGPVELASLAELAAARKDRDLAAALCGRVSAMRRDDRPFSTAELADVMFGEQHRELSQALVEAERRVLEALQTDQDFETGRINPQRAVEIAVLKKREASIGAYTRVEDADPAEEADAA